MAQIKRITKEADKQYNIHNPEGDSWWRYLEPDELNVFENNPNEYGLTDIVEAKRCEKMKGRKCQKMAWSKDFVSQWEGKDKGGKYLRIPLAQLEQHEYEIDKKSGFGIVLGKAAIRIGKLEE